MSSQKTRKSGNYHHGNAKAALLSAAHALLESEGAANLSLRQVAERAQLSRQAPYNHFADKEALLAGLVREGFERLSDAVGEAVRAPDGNALARAGERYIEFAQIRPALFRLMFSRERVELSKFPATAAAAQASFAQLSAIVADFAAADRVAELTLAAWSLVHGYALLCIEANVEPNERRAERARLFARLIQGDAGATR